jgi:ribulose-5-phosphate 4-epimerase/fuculose-1-phosphate aldolase
VDRNWDRQALDAARQDLSACLRMAACLGLSEGVCNHFSFAPPPEWVGGREDLFLVNPLGLSFAEVTPDRLLLCAGSGEVLDGEGTPEATAFFIHARLHARLPRARAAFHTHMPHATALACLDGPPLLFAVQSALRFWGRIAVDRDYNGLALDAAEGDRIAAAAGDADVLVLQNHGVIVLAPSIAEAWDDLYYLERAAEAEWKALASGRPVRPVAPAIAARVAAEIAAGQPAAASLHLASIRRRLGITEAAYSP